MSKIIYGLYNDDEILVKGGKTLRSKGVSIQNAYSPFPVHGLDKVLGVAWTRLAICAFIYAMIGVSLALSGMYYFMIVDWPMDIGGKPSFSFFENALSFVPITFELGVLCAAHGMVITFLFRSWIFPGVTPKNPDPRTTDDHFAFEIHQNRNSKFSEEEIKSLLKESGAIEVWAK